MPSEGGVGEGKSSALNVFEFGAVVLVAYPSTSQLGSKRRPAVVVSGALYAERRPDVILMPITSQVHATASFGEVWLTRWSEAGLLKPSAVKPLLATFEQRLVTRRLGRLAPDDQHHVRQVLTLILD